MLMGQDDDEEREEGDDEELRRAYPQDVKTKEEIFASREDLTATFGKLQTLIPVLTSLLSSPFASLPLRIQIARLLFVITEKSDILRKEVNEDAIQLMALGSEFSTCEEEQKASFGEIGNFSSLLFESLLFSSLLFCSLPFSSLLRCFSHCSLFYFFFFYQFLLSKRKKIFNETK
jgi:hypothetical protein